MPHRAIGPILDELHGAAEAFRAALAVDAAVQAEVFRDADAWRDLLTYKLLPHLSGEGCLVVAVAGGTNTGKSTVFNLLLGAETSPVRYTAAATCRPVLAASASRAQQCLEGKLLAEFEAMRLDAADAPLDRGASLHALYVVASGQLPDRMLLLDTPDVDSIDTMNWEVADHLRAAGDVVIAVLTDQKYKDERVVGFFRAAQASGRHVLPLMNKANPADDYRIARIQVEEFCRDAGLDAPPCFVLPHDFNLSAAAPRPVEELGGARTLLGYLESLDVPAMKARVYRDTVAHFAGLVGRFVEDADAQAERLRRVAAELEARAGAYAAQYEPAPGAKVGGLFHEFVQTKRGAFDRAIGEVGRQTARVAGTVGRAFSKAVLGGRGDRAHAATPEDRLRDHHKLTIERIAREFLTGCIESARAYGEPAGRLIIERLEAMEVEAAVDAVAARTLAADDISEAFRAHAHRQLEGWWNDHAGRRQVILALDRVLAVAPAGIAAWFAVQTAGVGLAETLILAGPFMEQFAARVVEYQFGDQMFNFVAPWRKEQQDALRAALHDEIVSPALRTVREVIAACDGEAYAAIKRCHARCQAIE